MNKIALAALVALMATACETPEPVPAEMETVAFQSAITDAAGQWHPYAKIEAYTEILDNQILSQAQRSRVLYERGVIRTDARINLPGAIQDLMSAQTITATTLFTRNFDTVMATAQTDLQRARARMSGLQTLPQWFDDAVAVGDIDLAAQRYRESGLSPDAFDAGTLEAAGYLCRKRIGRSDDWDFGDDNSHLSNLEWCSTNSGS